MKSLNYLMPVCLFITLLAISCDDEGCDTLKEHEQIFELELSSTAATFGVDDQLTIVASFSANIPSQFNSFGYNISGQDVSYEFELFEVQSENLPVTPVGDKIELSSIASSISMDEEDIFNSIRVNCEQNCSFHLELDLKETGYYGIIFRQEAFVNMEDCIVVKVTGEKSTTQNLDLLNEIGTQSIIYESEDSPVQFTETNSFFFKVE